MAAEEEDGNYSGKNGREKKKTEEPPEVMTV